VCTFPYPSTTPGGLYYLCDRGGTAGELRLPRGPFGRSDEDKVVVYSYLWHLFSLGRGLYSALPLAAHVAHSIALNRG
jgi:hypothetical protein